jgi:hypothetical protein
MTQLNLTSDQYALVAVLYYVSACLLKTDLPMSPFYAKNHS